MRSTLLAWLPATFLISTGSKAMTVVDTGPASGTEWRYGTSTNQWVAAEFSLLEDVTLSGVAGWMSGALGETGTIAIYSDGGDLPGAEIFSASFTGTSDSGAWQGVSSVSWALTAGTYWVSFERRSGQTMNGILPGGSANPLGNEAFRNTFGSGWVADDALDIGVRIDAVSAIPVPAALWLFASALAGLCWGRNIATSA